MLMHEKKRWDELTARVQQLERELKAKRESSRSALEAEERRHKSEAATWQFCLAERDRMIAQLKAKLEREETMREVRVAQLLAERQVMWFKEHTQPVSSESEMQACVAEAGSESEAILRRNPELSAALRGEAALLVYLDGHNILNGLGRYKRRRGTAMTHTDLRAQVEKDVGRLFKALYKTYVHLIWDGDELSTREASENMSVHYSGGEGEHRADRYILELLKNSTTPDSVPVLLVTDDKKFAGAAQTFGAKSCSLHDFEAFLNVSAY